MWHSLDSDRILVHIPTGARSLSGGYFSTVYADQTRNLTAGHIDRSGIKCARYEEDMRRLLFLDHNRQTSPESEKQADYAFLPCRSKTPERGKTGGICDGQILTLVMTTTCVLLC